MRRRQRGQDKSQDTARSRTARSEEALHSARDPADPRTRPPPWPMSECVLGRLLPPAGATLVGAAWRAANLPPRRSFPRFLALLQGLASPDNQTRNRVGVPPLPHRLNRRGRAQHAPTARAGGGRLQRRAGPDSGPRSPEPGPDHLHVRERARSHARRGIIASGHAANQRGGLRRGSRRPRLRPLPLGRPLPPRDRAPH